VIVSCFPNLSLRSAAVDSRRAEDELAVDHPFLGRVPFFRPSYRSLRASGSGTHAPDLFRPEVPFAFFNGNDRLHGHSRAPVEFTLEGDLPQYRFVLDGHTLDEAATRLKDRIEIGK
jgi:hypothetical protein